MRTLALLFCAALLAGVAPASDTDHTYTPPKGSSERLSIMDVARLASFSEDATPAQRKQYGTILCQVRHLKVHGDWALTCIQPVNPNGKPVVEFQWILLHRKSGKWINVHYLDKIAKHYPRDDFGLDALDLTDSAIRFTWQEFPSVPHDIFPPLGSRGRFFSNH